MVSPPFLLLPIEVDFCSKTLAFTEFLVYTPQDYTNE